ncbi:putative modified peptide [Pseudoxanthomonas sp. NC8]|nr:putative modified peptide [Pseudoxanthomonas sp. NC8]
MATKKTGTATPLDPKVARKLLDKLGTDNEFRRLFKKDPKAALVASGYKVAKGDAAGDAALAQVAGCLSVERIAPKATVLQARDTLEAQLLAGMAMNPIQLNVASTASRRKRS